MKRLPPPSLPTSAQLDNIGFPYEKLVIFYGGTGFARLFAEAFITPSVYSAVSLPALSVAV